MKIRTGFVSNSSSSSFLVHVSHCFRSKELLISPVQKQMLKTFGFLPTWVNSPHTIEEVSRCTRDWGWVAEWPQAEEASALGYHIPINQDDVVGFLLTNKIPFEAACHYGAETMIYRGEDEPVYTIQNYGFQVCGGVYASLDRFLAGFPGHRSGDVITISRENWLAREYPNGYPGEEVDFAGDDEQADPDYVIQRVKDGQAYPCEVLNLATDEVVFQGSFNECARHLGWEES